jgi:hypothetical protein
MCRISSMLCSATTPDSVLLTTPPAPNCMQLPEFAVDTHVWEISKALGWVPTNASRDQVW